MTQEVYPKVITDLPEADIPFKGIKGWLLQGKDRQMIFFDIETIGVIPEHSHGEQWGVIVEGELTLVIEGVEKTYKKGDSYHIPAGAVHSASFGSPCKVIDIFADADRYVAKG